jgi:hypothetical protein
VRNLPNVLKIVLSDVSKTVSAVATTLLASLRFVVATLLVLMLFWILVEMALNVEQSSYCILSVFFFIILVLLVAVIVLRCVELAKAGVLATYSGSLQIIPFAILDLVLIYAAIFVSGQMDSPLTTPLLRFCQTITKKLMS